MTRSVGRRVRRRSRWSRTALVFGSLFSVLLTSHPLGFASRTRFARDQAAVLPSVAATHFC